uniref:Uncharacterized protein n=1 Tax=Leersia perrieri TaxID=77586 RepID=A0A0D9XYI1_9ORYZ
MARDWPLEPGSVLPRSAVRDATAHGLMNNHAVFRDYQSRRLSSLQERPWPSYKYTDPNDAPRTHIGSRFDWSENELCILIRHTLDVNEEMLTLLPPA